MDRQDRQLFSLGIVVVLLTSVVGGAAATTADSTQYSHDGPPEAPAFVVDLAADGDATVTVSYTYNLSDADRKAAFQDLRNSSSVREDFRDRFESRLQRVANSSENATGREMSVDNATLDLRTEGDTGIVTASVQWNGIAAVDADRVTLTEPLASGFTSERTVHVYAPDGYTVSSAAPSPGDRTEGHLQWASDTDLTGFEVVATAPEDTDESTATATPAEMDDDQQMDTETVTTATTDGESPGGSGPGFGVAAMLAALAAVALFARR